MKILKIFVVLAIALLVSSCATAVPGPAGDAGITYTQTGAEGEVGASADQVAAASSDVLARMGIHPTGTVPQEEGHIVRGQGQIDQVSVLIRGSGSNSQVEVVDY